MALECPSCGRLYPEVVGAPTQVCPHCGHETGAQRRSRGRGVSPLAPDPVGALQHAWGVVRRDHVKLLLIWLPAGLAEVASALALAAYERSTSIPADPLALTTGERMQWLGVALPLLILVMTLRLGLWTFVAARALGRPAPVRALAPLAFAAGFVLTLTYAAGLLFLIMGFFVFLHWFLYVPAHLARGARLGAAFEASRRFARERRTYGFTALVSVLGATILLVGVLAGGVTGSAGILAGAAVGWILGPVVPLLAASYVAVASDVTLPAHASPSPTPRAATACPKCGTLIPYEPSGTPIQIVCPSCGHAGRVL